MNKRISIPTDPISPIRISANGRYFVDPQGHPVFWLGDTQWELFRLFTGVDIGRLDATQPVPYANLHGERPWIDDDPLKPKLALADSAAARRLLDGGRLDVDYLEVHGPCVDDARAALPGQAMLLHNALYDWSLGHSDALRVRDAATLTRQRLVQTQTPWFSVHLGFSAAQVAFRDREMHIVSEQLGREALLDAICATVTQLQVLSPVPLLLENLDYCPTGAYEHVCMPDFITAVLETTDTWMLLDLAHAQVSAAALGFPLMDYLAQLPLHRVRQLHVSGPRQVDGRLVDAHDPLREADFQLLEQMVARTQPWAITLEYTRDADTLECQARRLSALYPGKDGS